jgi:hypothetical protein
VRDSRSPDEGFVFGVILFGQWIAAQTPLWLARIAWGQRLAFSDSNHSGSRRRELQFGLGQLLGLTACVAVLLGLARWFLAPIQVEELQRDWEFFLIVVGFYVSFNTLAPLPTMWAAFARPAALWLFLAALYLAGVTIVEATVARMVSPYVPAWPDVLSFFAWINGTMYLVVAVTLLAIRHCGFQLRGARTEGK